MKEKDLDNSKIIYENLEFLLGDKNAVEFCINLWQISQLFDDIYDEGGISKEECIDLIFRTMTILPQNKFYNAYRLELQPLINSMFIQWISANKIEENKDETMLEKSYMLRAFIFQIFHYCAMLLKGSEFALSESIDFQKCYGETFEDYKKEFVEVKNV